MPGRGPKIPPGAIRWDFCRSSGPGGQNVNKVETAVRLRFEPSRLPPEIRERLVKLAGSRLAAGEILIEARRWRTREMNRRDALRRLERLLEAAARRPRPRKATRPSSGARRKRLDLKHRRGAAKALRRHPSPGED